MVRVPRREIEEDGYLLSRVTGDLNYCNIFFFIQHLFIYYYKYLLIIYSRCLQSRLFSGFSARVHFLLLHQRHIVRHC